MHSDPLQFFILLLEYHNPISIWNSWPACCYLKSNVGGGLNPANPENRNKHLIVYSIYLCSKAIKCVNDYHIMVCVPICNCKISMIYIYIE